jgi:hypothetical protein
MFNKEGVIILNENFDPKSLNEDLYLSKSDAIKENFELCMNHEKADDVLFRKIMEDIG